MVQKRAISSKYLSIFLWIKHNCLQILFKVLMIMRCWGTKTLRISLFVKHRDTEEIQKRGLSTTQGDKGSAIVTSVLLCNPPKIPTFCSHDIIISFPHKFTLFWKWIYIFFSHQSPNTLSYVKDIFKWSCVCWYLKLYFCLIRI